MGNDKPAGPERVPPAPLLRALGAVTEWLEATATPGAIIWIRGWLADFERALDRTDLLDEFNRVLARVRRPEAFGGSAE